MAKEKKINLDDLSLDEIKKLSQEADNFTGFQLGIEDDESIEELQVEFLKDTQNPDVSHKIYYAIEAILKTTLPKGKKNEKLRKFVREEKKIFLNRGHKIDENGRRGSDSRQAYISSHLEVALICVLQWVKEGGNAYDLFLKFRNLNIEHGYMSTEIEEQKK